MDITTNQHLRMVSTMVAGFLVQFDSRTVTVVDISTIESGVDIPIHLWDDIGIAVSRLRERWVTEFITNA